MEREQLIDINQYHQQLLDELDLDLDLTEEKDAAIDLTSMIIDLDRDEEKFEQPIPDIHQVVDEIDETKASDDLKALPLIARLGILGAKIREDPTGWFFFCANHNAQKVSPALTSASTKHVDLKAETEEEAKKKFQHKAENVIDYVQREVTRDSPFAQIARYTMDNEAYVSSSYNELVQDNCMRIVSNQPTIQLNLPFNTVIETPLSEFPYRIIGKQIAYENLTCNASKISRFADAKAKHEYYYLNFSWDQKRDQSEFMKICKRSNWPNFLWRENKRGNISHHYLLPITSPAIFKTWMFLHQYYRSIGVKQKIDKFSIQSYFQKFDYSVIDLNRWYGPHYERQNLNGRPVCAAYRAKYFKNGKFIEPARVPMTIPTGACSMGNLICTCFVYPGELLDTLKIPVEIILQDGKYMKKPSKIGKICFYCGTRYHGVKCTNINHSKNLNNFVRLYAEKYKIDATATDNSCKNCPLIIRVEKDTVKRSLLSNELVVLEDFFDTQHWKFLQSAYMSNAIYLINYQGNKRKIIDSVDPDNDISIQFINSSEEVGHAHDNKIYCKKKKCDKLVNLYINDKIASILQTTLQPIQFPEGYLLTLIPMKKVDKVIQEAFDQQSSLISVYDPMKEESLYKDYCEKKKNIEIKQAEMFVKVAKRKNLDTSELPEKKKLREDHDDLEFHMGEIDEFILDTGITVMDKCMNIDPSNYS